MTEIITKKTAPKSAVTTDAKPGVKVDLTMPTIKEAIAQGLALLKEGKTKADAARAVIAAGLHPGIGLHHSNDGNPMRLVDDVMEPFRPMIDLKVWQLWRNNELQVTSETKRALVHTLYADMQTDSGVTPVMVCIQKLATSLAKVYLGQREKLDLPLHRPPRLANELRAADGADEESDG